MEAQLLWERPKSDCLAELRESLEDGLFSLLSLKFACGPPRDWCPFPLPSNSTK